MINSKISKLPILERRLKVFVGIVFLILIFKGCIPEEDEVEDRKVSRIELVPNESSLSANEQMVLNATVYDQHNDRMDEIVLTWSSSSEDVAAVSSTGLVDGLIEGE